MVKSIYKEVMLDTIHFDVDNTIIFNFYHAGTGKDIDRIKCKGISLFHYSSGLLLGEESMPYFVLDVTAERIDKEKAYLQLTKYKYSFHQQEGEPTLQDKEFYYIFKIQGGCIDIAVICQDIE